MVNKVYFVRFRGEIASILP